MSISNHSHSLALLHLTLTLSTDTHCRSIAASVSVSQSVWSEPSISGAAVLSHWLPCINRPAASNNGGFCHRRRRWESCSCGAATVFWSLWAVAAATSALVVVHSFTHQIAQWLLLLVLLLQQHCGKVNYNFSPSVAATALTGEEVKVKLLLFYAFCFTLHSGDWQLQNTSTWLNW